MFESNWIIKKEDKCDLGLFERIKYSRSDAYMLKDCEGLDCLHDPFLINEMSWAVECIVNHVNKGSKICIHGDYDCDGVTSAYIVFDYLKSIGADVEWFIPDRFDDGYGISVAKAKSFSSEMVSLVITTDCGVTAIEEVEFIRNQGIDVIVTDHHQVKESLPNANAVLCNSRKDNKYPYPYLSGAGMALKLVQAISNTLGNNDAYIKYVGLCAIGTISDIVPLTGENKVLAGRGLEIIKHDTTPGLKAIIENAGIDKDKIDAYSIGFMIGPRINAAGRMGNAALAFELLDEKDFGTALKKADELSRLNNLRKTEQEKTFNELKDYVLANRELLDYPILLLHKEDIHKGILGIVASKLVDLFRKPVFVMKEENGICEGSGRSVEGFSLISALNKASGSLLGFGGHDMAAGMRMKSDAIPELLLLFKEIYGEKKIFKKEIIIDTLCSLDEIDTKMIKRIDELGPFGAGNMNPVLAIENAYITCKKEMGKSGNHLSFDITKEGRAIRCIAFNAQSYKHLIVEGQKYNIAFAPEVNYFRGQETPQARLVDIMLPEENETMFELIALKTFINKSLVQKGNFNHMDLSRELLLIGMPETAGWVYSGKLKFKITRDFIEDFFKTLKEYDIQKNKSVIESSDFMQIISIEILCELGILSVDRNDLFSYYNININDGRRNGLENSLLYRSLME